VRFYQGGKSSPIPAAKKKQGYSLAWQHHKGRNPHHYEYWMDNFDQGTTAIRMPYKYAVEMICDFLAAGQTYADNMGETFTYKGELEYVVNKFDNGCAMHISDQRFVYLVLRNLKIIDNIPIMKNCKCMRYILKDKFFNERILSDLYKFSAEVSDEEFKEIRNSMEHGFFAPKKGVKNEV
jgi:hypothetical protein